MCLLGSVVRNKIYSFKNLIQILFSGVKVNLTSDLTEVNESNKAVTKPKPVDPQPPDIMTDNAVHDDGESLEVGRFLPGFFVLYIFALNIKS